MISIKKKPKRRPISIRRNLAIYWSFLKPYTFLFVLALLAILMISVIHVFERYLFKYAIDGSTQFGEGTLASSAFLHLLFLVAAFYLASLLIKALMNWLQFYFIHKVESNMILDLKHHFFKHLVYLSHKFHTTHKSGSLISRIIRGGGAVENMTDVLVFNIAPLLFELLVVSYALFSVDRRTIFVIFFTVAAFIAYSTFIQYYQRRQQSVANVHEDTEKAYISDVFTNVDSIKYFGKENSITSRFHTLASRTKNAFFRTWNYNQWSYAGQNIIVGLGTFFLLFLSFKSFLRGDITVGTLVFVYTTYNSLLGPLYGFMNGMGNFHRSIVNFDDLFQYGTISNDIVDKLHAPKLNISKGQIVFKDVSFSYYKSPVLHTFNLTIHSHEKVALIGHSGSGKSTVIKLLYRLYDVDQGAIFIDVKNIKDVQQESLRSALSIVPQECVLFDDTIYNNIAFSNSRASKREVWQAIRFAQLDKTIAQFPDKDQTIVGERGVKLSGGEKQRVSLARALLANKKILILDEATSSLDSQTEHDIQQDLKQLMKGRTVLIIAHRLSTIMHADKIVVLDKGKIIQLGTHEQLIRQKGKYRTLWRLQQGGYIK
ncbi:MAG: ABC transporter ATP-binding protein [Candidatus Woesearchaeota archaeon]|nr:ABC transporter ATP-binding protein [Candidatus Woesearchaeota archaeon]